ncbi:MAG: CPBP family intramembrane metalloprotease [Planctomycetaceae bacterium]|jgi:membrane protease YdiL (CAAX protease family)|nr:CPBP family intramembrane metalloprotease [Planctomycetaceae bacterium]
MMNENLTESNTLEIQSQNTNKRLRFADILLIFILYSILTLILQLALIGLPRNAPNEPTTIHLTNQSINQSASQNIQQNIQDIRHIHQKTQSDIKFNIQITVGEKEITTVENLDQTPNQISIPQIDLKYTPPEKQPHPFVQLLKQDKSEFTILLLFICGVIIAPLLEEFLYRGIFTGWLIDSTKEHLPKFGFNETTTKILRVIISLSVPALLFASLHFRGNQEQSTPSREFLLILFLAMILINSLTLTIGIFYLTQIRNFTLEKIGFQMNKYPSDISMSILVSIFVIPLLLILTGILNAIFPNLVIDPFPLFFFAILLGGIFLITHRLLPCILIHALLNFTSLVILVLQ